MRSAVLMLGVLLTLAGTAPAGHAQAPSDSTYTVRSGDTLYSIAQRAGVSVATLQRWNDLEGTALQIGQTLRLRPPRPEDRTEASADTTEARPDSTAADSPLPDTAVSDTVVSDTTVSDTVAVGTSDPDSPAVDSVTAPPVYGRHVAADGDSFVTLALRLGTTADTLSALNDRTAAPLAAGETLRLPKRFAPPAHVVASGETLYSIAGEYGVSARALRTANGLDTTALEPGRRLRLPGREAPEVPSPGDWAAPDSTGAVAVYPDAFAGRLTASGTPYDPDALVVSHPSLPYNSVVLLSRPDVGRHTFARVLDRGPIEAGTLLDVSAAVADRLGLDADATPTVELRTVWIEGRAE
ncbi:LysM peptidoglycan-binding domain-containing protein [Salinibacter ruber]|uniref:LysM peptidoglycan-binding domain-containing protein n=1 Tax=Salinibacter ruber TaxID=146919 RepID=UPI0021679EB8|nr:LysM peptidoglycan-binding domain-containing protein [Salinibacter ruber]MCS3757638.1 LysM repeat protein [Salinibacter ruber]MCS3954291.1 LysM repeat protein [Salinibacter ruber]MCS4040993.1 LysM repeat protein [Salinibacter ruber]MCS4086251.1 LysM repeat protein [Salinibacter ruber]